MIENVQMATNKELEEEKKRYEKEFEEIKGEMKENCEAVKQYVAEQMALIGKMGEEYKLIEEELRKRNGNCNG